MEAVRPLERSFVEANLRQTNAIQQVGDFAPVVSPSLRLSIDSIVQIIIDSQKLYRMKCPVESVVPCKRAEEKTGRKSRNTITIGHTITIGRRQSIYESTGLWLRASQACSCRKLTELQTSVTGT